jgi:hypothetical protein
MKRLLVTLAVLAAPVVARPDAFSLGVEGTIGAPRLGVERVPGRREPLATTGDVGGAVLLKLGPLGVGAAMDRSTGHASSRLSTRSAMGGLALDVLPFLRLELFGEIGEADLAGDQAGNVRFHGARPGLSLRVPVVPLRLGVWGLARWGLPGTKPGDPSFGILARAGLEFF